ncbi:MAG: histidine phosphatase family protein [Eubacterium sp.]|nr:histidine phosphatase family protein [Eubacterium sp.]
MEIYILRHGTTEWNAVHRIQGTTDIMLDGAGLEMARQTGKYFKENGISFDAVFCSPLKRARMTAEIVSNGAPITEDFRLRELEFGFQEGGVVEELEKQDVPLKFFRTRPALYDEKAEEFPDVEKMSHLCERAAEFLKEVVEPIKDKKRILIAAHGACNKGLLMHVRGESDIDKFWGIGLQPNCGVTVVGFDTAKGTYNIIEENRIFYEITKNA